jgi:hypothetical protein
MHKKGRQENNTFGFSEQLKKKKERKRTEESGYTES